MATNIVGEILRHATTRFKAMKFLAIQTFSVPVPHVQKLQSGISFQALVNLRTTDNVRTAQCATIHMKVSNVAYRSQSVSEHMHFSATCATLCFDTYTLCTHRNNTYNITALV